MIINFCFAQVDTSVVQKEIDNAKVHAKFYRYSGYIPYDILDCIRVISATYEEQYVTKFKNRSLSEVYSYGIDSTVTGLRKSWELEGRSHLAQYFNELGLYYHKSMKLTALLSYHEHLNGKTINVKRNVRLAKGNYSKQERAARKRTKRLNRIQKKNYKETIEFEDAERDNSYKKHSEFYETRDKNLRKLEKKRARELKKRSQ